LPEALRGFERPCGRQASRDGAGGAKRAQRLRQ
jgi:hypothetical protein